MSQAHADAAEDRRWQRPFRVKCRKCLFWFDAISRLDWYCDECKRIRYNEKRKHQQKYNASKKNK